MPFKLVLFLVFSSVSSHAAWIDRLNFKMTGSEYGQMIADSVINPLPLNKVKMPKVVPAGNFKFNMACNYRLAVNEFNASNALVASTNLYLNSLQSSGQEGNLRQYGELHTFFFEYRWQLNQNANGNTLLFGVAYITSNPPPLAVSYNKQFIVQENCL